METIHIVMDNCLRFDITNLNKDMIKEIKKDFRVRNPNYDAESKDDGVAKYLHMYDIDKNNMMTIPRGSSAFLCAWFDKYDYEYEIEDKRLVKKEVDYPDVKFTLFKHQKKWVRKGLLVTQGTIESPCGSGKTIGGISLMTKCRQPALIIVPDNELLKQWVGNLAQTLGESILKYVGVITSETVKYENYYIDNGIGKYITVTTNISAYNIIKENSKFTKEFINSFGFVLLDECHRVAARTFRYVMNSFPAKYKYGLTATPFRNDSLTELIEAYCGTQFYTVTDDELEEAGLIIRPTLTVIETKFKYNYNPKYARYMYNKIVNALQNDVKRNNLIIQEICKRHEEGKMCLVIAKRVDHCRLLASMLKKEYPTKKKKIRIAVMAGDVYDVEAANDAKEGKVDVIFAVDRAKEGLDIKPLQCLFIVAPRKARGEVEQIVGRIMRADTCFGKYKTGMDKEAEVIDFYDEVPMLENAYKERYKVYKEKCIIE